MKTEQQKLSEISQWYTNRDWGFYTKLVYFSYLSIKSYIKPGAVLEIGPADGEMTKFINKITKDLTVVDASENYIQKIKENFPHITGITCMAEDYHPSKRFDTIILAHVLEHVIAPQKLILHLGKLLQPDGNLIIVVPNAYSLHRQIGVKMGLIKTAFELNEADKSVDHKRVYDFSHLKKDVSKSGLKVNHQGGIFLKPLSNKQIESNWDNETINGFYELGKDMPEICSEIFVVCRK